MPQQILTEPVAGHTIDIVIDRLKSSDAQRSRLAESFEAAVKAGDGRSAYLRMDTGERRVFHTRYCCPVCEATAPDLSPAMFSFNNALGACPYTAKSSQLCGSVDGLALAGVLSGRCV